MRLTAARLAPFALAALLVTGCAQATGNVSSSTSKSGSASALPATGSGTDQLQSDFVTVVRNVRASVVEIVTDQALGSGVIFDTQGDIVTNNHVVAGASTMKVVTADGKQRPARLLGTFPPDDLAVLKVSGSGLQAASFGDSSKLQTGDIVMAIGNPLGLGSSVTEGIVSALGRTVTEPGGNALPNAVQTSAAINPGNSGGALVDLAGQVVGIPTLTATDPQIGGAAAGIGFAIPSNIVTDIASQIIKNGRVVNSHRAYLGVSVGDTTSGGVVIQSLQSNGPAAKAGLQVGDLITSVAGVPTPTVADLSSELATLQPGQQVKVAVIRADGSNATVTVTLGQYPGS